MSRERQLIKLSCGKYVRAWLKESDNEYSDTEINFSIWMGKDRANLIMQSL